MASTETSKEKWIACDTCSQWMHYIMCWHSEETKSVQLPPLPMNELYNIRVAVA